jgi:peptidoglycan-associated lipoprotein
MREERMYKSNTTLKVVILGFGLLALAGCKHYHGDKDKTAAGQANTAANGNETMVGGAGDKETFNSTDSQRLGNTDTYYFAFNSNVIAEQDVPKVNAQGEHLASNAKAQVRLDGFTDERGSREYNIALGQRRADSVAQALQAKGVNPGQIETVSYGAERPAVNGHDEEAYRMNRRVELAHKNGTQADQQQG